MKVRDIMTEPPLTCTPETSLAGAARLMWEAGYGTLPVVDSCGRLVGIVTDRDICLTLAGTPRSALQIAVREVMTRNVFSVFADDDVSDALVTMRSARVRRVPVCDESGWITGMLSIEDVVMRALDGHGIAAGQVLEAMRAMYVRGQLTPDVAKRGPAWL